MTVEEKKKTKGDSKTRIIYDEAHFVVEANYVAENYDRAGFPRLGRKFKK